MVVCGHLLDRYLGELRGDTRWRGSPLGRFGQRLGRLNTRLFNRLAKDGKHIGHRVLPEGQPIELQQARLPERLDRESLSPQLSNLVLFVRRFDGLANDVISTDGFGDFRQERHRMAAAFQQALALRLEPLAEV